MWYYKKKKKKQDKNLLLISPVSLSRYVRPKSEVKQGAF